MARLLHDKFRHLLLRIQHVTSCSCEIISTTKIPRFFNSLVPTLHDDFFQEARDGDTLTRRPTASRQDPTPAPAGISCPRQSSAPGTARKCSPEARAPTRYPSPRLQPETDPILDNTRVLLTQSVHCVSAHDVTRSLKHFSAQSTRGTRTRLSVSHEVEA